MGSVDADTPSDPGRRARTGLDRPLALLGLVAAGVVVLDQLTKWWALEALTDPVRIVDVVWTLRFRVIYNTGTAFSLTSDSGPIVSVIGVVVVGYLVLTARHQRSGLVVGCFGLIVGGTIGNLLDRLFRDGDGFLGGPVIDFVDLQWFPVWNLADAALVIGIAIMLLAGIRTDGSIFEDADAGRARTGGPDDGAAVLPPGDEDGSGRHGS